MVEQSMVPGKPVPDALTGLVRGGLSFHGGLYITRFVSSCGSMFVMLHLLKSVAPLTQSPVPAALPAVLVLPKVMTFCMFNVPLNTPFVHAAIMVALSSNFAVAVG